MKWTTQAVLARLQGNLSGEFGASKDLSKRKRYHYLLVIIQYIIRMADTQKMAQRSKSEYKC